MKELCNEDIFIEYKIKNTKQRDQILSILKDSKEALSAEEIYGSLMIKKSNLSLSTIYRTLDLFESKEIIVKTYLSEDNKALYKLNDLTHKHYLICSRCKQRVEINKCPLSGLEKDLSEKTGYVIFGHKLEMHGFCPKCQ